MKRYFARILLWSGSLFMVLAGNLIALVAVLAGSDRAWPVIVANDQAMNAGIAGKPGSEDETVSSHAGKAARKGRVWGCILCRLLDLFDPRHCEKSIEEDEGERVIP